MSGKIFVAAGATAVAGITLGFGLVGAYASGKDQAPKPQKGTIWAVVNSDGTLARQTSDVTGVVHIAMGQYRVFAKGDVRNCAYEATAGDAGLGVPPVRTRTSRKASSTPEVPSWRPTTRRAPGWTAISI